MNSSNHYQNPIESQMDHTLSVEKERTNNIQPLNSEAAKMITSFPKFGEHFDNTTDEIKCMDKYSSHLITKSEVLELKKAIGIWNTDMNYNIIINGSGTGLTPPSEDDWEAMIGTIEVVDNVDTLDLPNRIDHSESQYFPAVGDQGIQASCTSWAVTYYAHGYYQAREFNWNSASKGVTTQLLSPTWTYNKVNKGFNGGSNFWRNFQVLKTIGAATWSKMPFIANDYTSWGTEQAWREAPKYRAVWYKQTTANNIKVIKSWLNDGYICAISIDGNEFDGLGIDDDTITSLEYNSTSHNHANALVGYDDTKIVDGEIGAFKAVNSWGPTWGNTKGGRNNSGGWNGSGYYWITYKAFSKLVRPIYIFQDMVDYEPKLLATWEFEENCSRDAFIKLGLGWVLDPEKIRNLYRNAGVLNYPKFMCLDITEFINLIHNFEVYLQVGTGVNKTNITSFKVELFENGYSDDGSNCSISRECPEVPKRTPNYYNNSGNGFFIKITNPQENDYCQGSLQITGTAKPAVSNTIFYENFEETFPIGWSIGDYNNNSGYDYWGNNTFRKSSGFKSGWCAGVKKPIFEDNFDNYNSFKNNWVRYSENASSSQPWNITNINYSFVYGGDDFGAVCDSNQSANITEVMYTKNGFNTSEYNSLALEFFIEYNHSGPNDFAQVLFANQSSFPNFTIFRNLTHDVYGIQRLNFSDAAGEEIVYLAFRYHGEFGNYFFVDDVKVNNNKTTDQYDNNMVSFMYREVNLVEFHFANLSYDYWIDSEPNIDILSIMYRSKNKWYILKEHTGSSNGWNSSYLIIPTNATHLRFQFESDSSTSNYEGVFIDNIVLIGYTNLSLVRVWFEGGPGHDANGLTTWSKSLSTLTEPDGANQIGALARYNFSVNTKDFKVISIDNLPPELFEPEAHPGTWTSDLRPVIAFEAIDIGSYIEHYEVKIDSGVFQIKISPYKVPTQNDGIHNITVRAFDIIGHYTDGNVSIFIDTEIPDTFTPTADPSSWSTNAQPVITFKTVDNLSGIENYMVKINDGNFSNKSSPYTLPPQPEGIHKITIRAYDKADNFFEKDINVYIDLTPPDQFHPRANPATWTNNNPVLSFSTTDNLSGIAYYKVRIDYGHFENRISPYTIPLLDDGIHNVTVRAFDYAGNFIDGYVNVYIDTTSPDPFSPSAKPNDWRSEPPTISFKANDRLSGIDHYEVKIDNGEFQIINSPYTLPELNDGIHIITVRAYDNADNYRENSIKVYIDKTPPVLKINFPVRDSWIKNQSLKVVWNCSDNHSDVQYCVINLDDKTPVKLDLTILENYYYTLSNLENGIHQLRVTIIDRANNNVTQNVEFKIDKNEPQLIIEEPKSKMYFNLATVTITWSGNDFESDIFYYELKVNEKNYSYLGTKTSYNLVGMNDGKYIVYIKAWDMAGNWLEESVIFYIDKIKPNLSILQPQNQQTITKPELTCTWTSMDNMSGLDHFEIKLDNNNYKNIGLSTSYKFLDYDEGSHEISIKAVDKAGNSVETRVNIIYKPEAKEPIETDYTVTIIGITFFLFLILLILIFFIRNRKKRPPVIQEKPHIQPQTLQQISSHHKMSKFMTMTQRQMPSKQPPLAVDAIVIQSKSDHLMKIQQSKPKIVSQEHENANGLVESKKAHN